MTPGSFKSRHIGPDPEERERMLRTIGIGSLDALIDLVAVLQDNLSIPSAILAAIAWGARHGVLFRGGAAIEKFARIFGTAVPAFFIREKPTSRKRKPTCMNITRIAATITQTV